MKHAVIFDIDGTLLASAQADNSLYRRAVEFVLGPVRFRDDLADYTHVSDSGILVELLRDNGLDDDPKLIEAIKNRFLAETRNHVQEFGPFEEIPGARSLLSRLRQSESHAVAIATGGWSHTARFKLETAGFAVDSVPLRTSDDAIDRLAIMRLALASLGEGLASTTYYGDGPWDELACRRLGWSFRAVGPRLCGIESFEGELVD